MKTFNFNEYAKASRNFKYAKGDFRILKEVVCMDGFSISVQASSRHYCQPRETGANEYQLVECGYPSQAPEFILQYAEDIEQPTETIYGYVPVELVNKLIDSHGGAV